MEGKRTELSGGSGTLKPVAEVLKVFRAGFELQHFPDHRREVCQQADRSEWRRIGGPRRTPRRREYERIFNRGQRHPLVIQPDCEQTIRTAHYARRPRRRTIRFENPPHVFALFHCLFHCR